MKKYIAAFAVFSATGAFAFVPPETPGSTAVSKAIGETLMSKFRNQGFSAAGARYIATLPAIEAQVARMALAAAPAAPAAAGGLPMWLLIAGGIALDVGLTLALDHWLPNLPQPANIPPAQNPPLTFSRTADDWMVRFIETSVKPNPNTAAVPPVFTDYGWYAGAPYEGLSWEYDQQRANPPGNQVHYGYAVAALYLTASQSGFQENIPVSWFYKSCNYQGQPLEECQGPYAVQRLYQHLNYGHCPSGYVWNGASGGNHAGAVMPECLPPPTVTETLPKEKLVPDFIEEMSPAMKEAPIDPAILAKLADKAWRDAAMQPGYEGIPYQPWSPVTPWDVDTAYSPYTTTGAPYPKVKDMFEPANPTGTTIVITPTPTTQEPGPTTPIDLGPVPIISEPTLELTPTASAILAPLLNLFPSFRSYVVPSHNSQCPTSSFAAFGRDLTIDSHCALAENVRQPMYLVMAAVWTIASIFVILSA